MAYKYNPLLAVGLDDTGNDAAAAAAGSDTQIQYNASGVLGASADLTWDDTGKELGVGGNIAVSDGSQSAPSLTFTDDSNTGIYSPGADQVAISTNGTGRLFVDASGRVGVGTNSPLEVLHVKTGDSGVTTEYGGVDGIIIESPAGRTGGLVFNTPNDRAAGVYFNDPDGIGRGYYRYDHNGDYAHIATAGSERLRITSDGKVGLGTSSPEQLLHIESNSSPTIYIKSASASAGTFAQLEFGNGTGATSVKSRVISYRVSAANAESALAFETTNAAGTTSEALRIDGEGNVGVGITTPTNQLEVGGEGIVRIRPAADNTSGSIYMNHITTGGNSYRGDVVVDVNGIGFKTATLINTVPTERARIDSSGRLLVGTSTSHGDGSPFQVVNDTANPIEVFRGQSSSAGPILLLNKSRGSTASPSIVSNGDQTGSIAFKGYDGGAYITSALIRVEVDGTPGTNDMPGRLVFSTTADGASSPTERMRITSSGIIAIGSGVDNTDLAKAGIPQSFWVSGASSASNVSAEFYGSSSALRYLVAFSNPNGVVGSISTNGTATAYNTSSDYRLKENITAVTDGITRLQQLKPSRFNFIADPYTTVDGFLAHEVQNIVPEAVTGEKDAVDENRDPVYQGIDQSKLVPLLTAALQEAIGRIETLEAEVAALKAQ